MSIAERARGSARPTRKRHYNSLPRTCFEGALGSVEILTGLARLAASEQPEAAVHLFAAAEAIQRRVGLTPAPSLRAKNDRALAIARGALGEEAFAAAWSVGGDFSLDRAVAEAQSVTVGASLPAQPDPDAGPSAAGGSLTSREVEVLRLVAEGMTNAQIAQELFLSPRTVNRHLNSVYHKLGVSSRSAASKVMWVGRATVFLVGLAVMLALLLGVATTALASIPGDPFRLGQTNGIDAMTTLVGNVAGTMLRVDNNSTGAGATALDLRVEPGKALMKVNSATRVALLNADKVDGKDSTEFLGKTEKATDSDTLDGQDSAAFLGTTQKAADSDKLDGKDSSAFAAAYKRTVVVSPTGTDTQNGTALLDAHSSITDASASKKCLIYIEPGTYDLGSGSLQMKQHVDIQGAGELNTLLTSSVSGCSTGTLKGANNAELRFLTMQNTATGVSCGAAIYNSYVSPQLTHVTAKSTGSGGIGTHMGVLNDNSSAPTMTDVTATASGGAENYGVANLSTSTIIMTNLTATAS